MIRLRPKGLLFGFKLFVKTVRHPEVIQFIPHVVGRVVFTHHCLLAVSLAVVEVVTGFLIEKSRQDRVIRTLAGELSQVGILLISIMERLRIKCT